MKERREMNVVESQVRKFRMQRGWSQPKMVTRCQLSGWDLSRESLAKIESRLRSVTDIEILKLSEILEVHHSELFPASH
ncbi:MAG TPA: helix-turn-helix transcriptional regulator [Rhabdochlamydiaceae bacterium]